MSNHPTCIFVYGSLRLGFRDPNYSYLAKYFNLRGEGAARGRFYFNGVSPVAVPVATDHFITGDVYELNNIDDFQWAFVQLDDYEGLHVEEGETPLYKRMCITVMLHDKPVEAWVYWFNGSTDNLAEMTPDDVKKYLPFNP